MGRGPRIVFGHRTVFRNEFLKKLTYGILVVVNSGRGFWRQTDRQATNRRTSLLWEGGGGSVTRR